VPHRFRELMVWQKAMDLAVGVYHFSRSFPKDEQFILGSQIRRAANSVPLNIAEGAGCRTDKEFAQFLGVAFRSCHEVATAAELAMRLGHVDLKSMQEIAVATDEVTNMIFGLMRKLDGG
jgi:four helix bundle protein